MKTYIKIGTSSFFAIILSALFFIVATPAQAAPMIPAGTQAQVLSAELGQLSQQLQAASSSSSAPFTFSQGQSLQISSNSASNGNVIITLTNFLHSNPDPTIPQIIPQQLTKYAEISLNYKPCVAAAPAVCVSEASSSYPVMTSILSPGQSTGYRNYMISLTSLSSSTSSSTATFQITDTSYLSEIQSALNNLAAQVQALLGA